MLGAVFDKVYFPGVYLPTDGYDVAELDKEVARIEALPIAQNYGTQEIDRDYETHQVRQNVGGVLRIHGRPARSIRSYLTCPRKNG